MQRIYFDHNATTPLRPAARAAMMAALDAGNPSSVHAEGRAARGLIESARIKLAQALGTTPELVVFTSGATEAANMALRPEMHGFSAGSLLIGGGEHACVHVGQRFPKERVEPVKLDPQGRLDLDNLSAKLATAQGPMLALQWVNNETGVIQPVPDAAALVHAAGGIVVCDAVQGFGRIDCSFATTGADILIISSHKIGGPKGVGALAFARRAMMPPPLIRGGGQERGHRGGTENVAAIAGFSAAAVEVLAGRAAEMQRLAALRDELQAGLLEIAPETAIFGGEAQRVGNTLAFALPGLAAATLVAAFDVEGVALSSGSACSSGKVTASQVLGAMGVPNDLASCALRLSLGWTNELQEVVRFLKILSKLRERMRSRLSKAV